MESARHSVGRAREGFGAEGLGGGRGKSGKTEPGDSASKYVKHGQRQVGWESALDGPQKPRAAGKRPLRWAGKEEMARLFGQEDVLVGCFTALPATDKRRGCSCKTSGASQDERSSLYGSMEEYGLAIRRSFPEG